VKRDGKEGVGGRREKNKNEKVEKGGRGREREKT
jgi:hypothetical protein